VKLFQTSSLCKCFSRCDRPLRLRLRRSASTIAVETMEGAYVRTRAGRIAAY